MVRGLYVICLCERACILIAVMFIISFTCTLDLNSHLLINVLPVLKLFVHAPKVSSLKLLYILNDAFQLVVYWLE